jgi:hypothetical protein
MKNIVAFLLAWAIAINIAVPAHGQTVTPTRRQTSLSSVDRSRIEALACRPLGVAVTEIVGSHALDGDSRKATAAVVKCAPHVRSEGVEAGLRAYCKRDGGVWACEEDDAYLRRLVAGKGPFEIAARGLTFDEAQTVIGCLETDLREQPELLDSGALTKVEFLLRAAPSDDVLIGLKSGSRCLRARLPLRCASEAGPRRPVAISSCGLE